ncbi:LIC12162 family protein [Selenomonas sp. F0473]|uniref:LIC12162 family transferase n=1 Tax=Selenomonas sp. F0473 TaxID=999423 RepID=UPI00029DDA5A|nr:LIC12162 family protein [Selenomonas sp. F0473]EKU70814.1 hypothetical protein HMPREF9161_01363 [Selenomonas sp. F0473]
MEEKRLFLPLTIEKKYWDLTQKMVFLNQVYAEQLDKEELYTTQYEMCTVEYPDCQSLQFKDQIKEIAESLGEYINQYSRIDQSGSCWEKVLYRWLTYAVSDIQVKIMQLEMLKKQYPNYTFYTYSKKQFQNIRIFPSKGAESLWEEEYHFWLYTYLAHKYYDVEVCFVDREERNVEKNVLDSSCHEKRTGIDRILCEFGRAYRKISHVNINKLKVHGYTHFLSRTAEVLYYGVDLPNTTTSNWILQSKGKIQPFSIQEDQDVTEIDEAARNRFSKYLINTSVLLPLAADLLIRVLPKTYFEEYRSHYAASMSFLHAHPRLKTIFSTTGALSCSRYAICSFLAQERGIRLLGFQHGGDHEINSGIFDHPEFFYDVFYFWGSGKKQIFSSECEIANGPSYKFYYYHGMALREENILFVGTTVLAYPRYDECGEVDKKKERYIQKQIEFFEALSSQARNEMSVREYYVDSGWHIERKIADRFPDIRFSGAEQISDNYAVVDIAKRNSSFAEALAICKLMVCDHLSTTWMEALYLDKPFIFLLNKDDAQFRPEALPYIRKLESVDVVLYESKKAAALINKIHNDVLTWWNQTKRKAVIRELRRRYLFEVENIDDWWREELLAQARR